MISLNTWRAEWIKARRRPANIAILITMICILFFVIAVSTGVALYDKSEGNPETMADMARQIAFPNGLTFSLLILSAVGSLLAIIYVANSVGSEYGRDTWKMILPRQGNRLTFLITKLLNSFAAIVLLIITLMVLGQLFGLIASLVMGTDLTVSADDAFFSNQMKSIAFNILNMAFYGAMTLLAAVATRSTIGGIIVGFISAQVLSGIASLAKFLALILPSNHLSNIQAQWVLKIDMLTTQVNATFGREVDPGVSLAVVMGYIVVFIGLGCYLFKTRDMAGN